MSSRIDHLLSEIIADFQKRFITSIKKIVQEGKYRHIDGLSLVNNYFIVDIGNNSAIYVEPDKMVIRIVSYQENTIITCDTLEKITILNEFASLLSQAIDKVNSRSALHKLSDTFHRTTLIDGKPVPNSVLFFENAETWYYKCLLSLKISSLCYDSSHKYSFPLPDGTTLLIHLPAVYMTDEGAYTIEKNLGTLTVFTGDNDNPQDILAACKYLVGHEEILRATK